MNKGFLAFLHSVRRGTWRRRPSGDKNVYAASGNPSKLRHGPCRRDSPALGLENEYNASPSLGPPASSRAAC
ncbi:protein of unknown function [Candidatus Methylocalor cossyra]|uniref:Uncharacterized protein n=1 Tax=Candidatus Methylocalor cossyra TaxID=3108543 RepID=A0ABM9NHJ1_9GAMM